MYIDNTKHSCKNCINALANIHELSWNQKAPTVSLTLSRMASNTNDSMDSSMHLGHSLTSFSRGVACALWHFLRGRFSSCTQTIKYLILLVDLGICLKANNKPLNYYCMHNAWIYIHIYCFAGVLSQRTNITPFWGMGIRQKCVDFLCVLKLNSLKHFAYRENDNDCRLWKTLLIELFSFISTLSTLLVHVHSLALSLEFTLECFILSLNGKMPAGAIMLRKKLSPIKMNSFSTKCQQIHI